MESMGKYGCIGVERFQIPLQAYLKPALIYGWSELTATNAPVEDEPVEPISQMIISLLASVFFFPNPPCPKILLSKKFTTSPLLPTFYLPPPTYHLPPASYLPPTNPTPPHSIARAPETSSGWS
jgi:hypothetical protein